MNWQNVINSLNAEALRIANEFKLNKELAAHGDYRKQQLLKMDIYTVLARALAEGLVPDDKINSDLIPAKVYFRGGNFYHMDSRIGMGEEFYNTWRSRASNFPAYHTK